jgi:hypothetical protein
MSIDIKSYKETFDKFEESSVIQNLFNLDEERVKRLLNFGFKYVYENRRFEAELLINDITHKITIYKSVGEKEGLVGFYVRFSPISESPYKTLIGASPELVYYYDITDLYPKLNTYAVFNYIYTVYRLNQKEEKITFNEFVTKEKGKETVKELNQ